MLLLLRHLVDLPCLLFFLEHLLMHLFAKLELSLFPVFLRNGWLNWLFGFFEFLDFLRKLGVKVRDRLTKVSRWFLDVIWALRFSFLNFIKDVLEELLILFRQFSLPGLLVYLIQYVTTLQGLGR